MTDVDGNEFCITDLPVTDASRFAICVAKKLFGEQYVANHIFDPSSKTKVAERASNAHVEKIKGNCSNYFVLGKNFLIVFILLKKLLELDISRIIGKKLNVH